ncbi:MAG: cytochrome c biogenesis protein CcsA [Candidatus Marinimicrobia bacterium]|nr:cytochrome c biogenesis protein CcsA [Candidatus Neomarinimicrobiota bacterium]
MSRLLPDKISKILFIVTAILMSVNLYVIFAVTPMVPEQHWAQKIFYVHVPIAWTGFLSYFIVMLAGIIFLVKKDSKWDRVGLAAAELGTMFVVLVLITGPIWATPIWGKPWIWEPRLTTTLILFLTYVGYFMLRKFGGHAERVARLAAVLGILAFINVPLIFYSVKLWTPQFQLHPQVEMNQQPDGILFPFLFSMFIFTLLYILMMRIRIQILNFKHKLLTEENV